MSDKTGIQWTEATWNPTVGCTRVSPGCEHCYAERQAARVEVCTVGKFKKTGKGPSNSVYLPVVDAHLKRWTRKVELLPGRLEQPLRWRKPRRIFVDSMSDLFHVDVPNEFRAAVFGVMAATSRHTYQILTKRPQRMREFFKWLRTKAAVRGDKSPRELCVFFANEILASAVGRDAKGRFAKVDEIMPGGAEWPLQNVHLGVSVEDQQRARQRVPPEQYMAWDSENGSAEMLVPHRLQLKSRKGDDPSEWPDDLRVQEMPSR